MLIHGECLEEMKNIQTESIDFIYTDIPYEISKKTNFKTIKDFTKKQWVTDYSCMDFWEWDKNIFNLEEYIKECLRILKNWRSLFIWCSWQQLELLKQYYIENCPKNKQWEPRIAVWQKTNPPVFNMDKMPIQPFEFWIWLRKWSKWTFNRKEKPTRLYWETSYAKWPHPTQKRIDISEDIIKSFTNEWDLVFDWLMGSWTTWIACKNLWRDFIWIELDEKYFKIAYDRIKGS